MCNDPIVEEIHKIREEIARQHDYNLDRIMDHLMKKEMEPAGQVIHKEELISRRMTSR